MLWQPSVRSSNSLVEAHERVKAAFRSYATDIDRRRAARRGYRDELIRRYRHYVEPHARVLELGVGTGDLLAALDAERAVGVDLSPEMLEVARESHPELELYEAPAEDVSPVEGPFDYIILSDLTVFLYDILAVFRGLHPLCHERTRVIINTHSRLWQPALTALAWIGLHHHQPRTNWVTPEDLTNLLELADFQLLKTDVSTPLPAPVPLLAPLVNRYLYRLPGVRQTCIVSWIIARPRRALGRAQDLDVSVICACRNEEGHIAEIVDRTPALGRRTELIFVEGGSQDDTWGAIQREIERPRRTDLEISAHRQDGRGKGNAVRVGFDQATGDILMILDADLTVPPEDLPEFVKALAEGKGEFINGSRLVYPMNDGAMRFLNVMGNKFFARVFTYLLGQPLKDTLCGTKVISRSDYDRLARGRSYFGEFDPFGDFDLLFGAAKLNLKLVELPIRYRERVYGDTNINRFRDGALLLRMSWVALRRLKFV